MAHFAYSIDYTREDGSHGGMVGGNADFDTAAAQMQKDVDYYIGLGYSVVVEHFRELCSQCHGAGDRQHKTNRFKRVPCKACKCSGVVREFATV